MRFVFHFTHHFLLTPDHTIISRIIDEIQNNQGQSHEIWGFFSQEAIYTLFDQSQFLDKLLDESDFTPIVHKDHLVSIMPGTMKKFVEKRMEEAKGKILGRSEFTALLSDQLIATDTCILKF
ncbi:MAG: hypothetical protein ACTSVZ_07135 [Promethearchaeota archaeon]